MALNINTNIGALGAAAAATSVNKSMETAMERLSTGLRINTAADDAAGVAIASRLSSEIRGTNMAIRNAMDGQAMIDTAEGAHNEIVNILQRMRELSVQAANDTNDANDRGNLQLEIDQLTTEINRIADVTTWAGQSLMNGSGGTAANGVFTFQVGTGTASQNQISTTINSMTAASLGVSAGSVSASANAATMTEVGNNALQLSGSPAAGDVFNVTVGGKDLAVKLISIADDPVVLAPSGIQTNGTDISVSGATLTVNAGATTTNDNFNINVNGTDVQVTATAGQTVIQTAAAIKTAIDAVSDLGVSVTDNLDGTLTFEPTTEYAVSLAPTATATMTFGAGFVYTSGITQTGLTNFTQTGTTISSLATDLAATDEIESAKVASNGTDIEIIFASTTSSTFTLADSASVAATVGTIVEGGDFGATQTAVTGNGIEGAAKAIAAAVNSRTSTDFLGLTATGGADGSVSFVQAVNFSSAGVDAGATSTMTFGAGFVYTAGLVQSGLTNFTQSGTTLASLVTDLAATDEIESATINANGTDIDLVYVNGPGHTFTLSDSAGVAAAQGAITAGTSDSSKASTSADGTVLTLTPTGYETGDEVNFTINGEAFTVAVSATDKYDGNQVGLIEKIQDQLDASTKQGGMTFTVAASSTNITITATAATDDLLSEVSTDPASATTSSTGLSVTTSASALTSITAIDAAISTVNTQRANLGAVSNRLDSTVANLTNISTNLEAGRSRIQDADFAAESTQLAKAQILQQASMAMLAQANASKQGVLSLLQG